MLQQLKKNKTETYALGRHICLSADRAKRVIDQIRSCSYEETLMILELMPYRACYPILKLVYSGVRQRSTCHITIVVKDISLDEYEYEDLYSLENLRSKKTTKVYDDVYSSGVVLGQKIN